MNFTVTLPSKSGNNGLVVIDTEHDIELPLIAIGDVHIGHQSHDEDTFQRVINKVAELEAPWICMGDLIENGSKLSIGDSWSTQTLTPQAQIDCAIEKLKPISKYCIGAVMGNHEFRTGRLMGIDPMQVICYGLDIPYFHDRFSGIIRAHNGNEGIAYSFTTMHTEMSSKTAGLDMNAVERDIALNFVFDLFIKGHSHHAYLSPAIPYETVDFANRSIVKRQRRIWCTGNYLRWEDSYAQKKPYKPLLPGTVMVWLSMNKDKRGMRAEEI